jgi:catechol 2,3-dioxygenase-like lactoylglutathione lyase family enzyme
MLGDHEPVATVAVSDLQRAQRFYETTLGLERLGSQGGQAITYRSGASKLLVYRSQFAGTNRATSVTWLVGDDVDRLVKDLEAKGVKFEDYDMPNTTRKGHVHVAGGTRVAWFKDPDGNIHSLVNGTV